MGYLDDLDQEAGINFADLDKEAGIAPVPTATRMLKEETVQTQSMIEEVKTETPEEEQRKEVFRQQAIPRSLLRLPGRRERYAKVGKNRSDKFKDELRTIRDLPDATPEAKQVAVREATAARYKAKMDDFTQIVQTPYDLKVMMEDARSLDTRGKKMSRRLDRGVVMLAGGGAYVIDGILRVGGRQMTASSDVIDGPQEMARVAHELINSKYMQPRVDDWVDKYVGGTVESAPYMAAAMAPAVLTGGATVPSLLAGAAVAYGVEGNSIYQENIDLGRTEKESRTRAMVGGMLSAGVEVAGGSGAKYFKKVSTSVVGKLARVKHVTGGVFKNALKEGLMEELPQEVISLIMTGNPPRNEDGSIDYDTITDQLFDAAAIGTFSGGFVDTSVRAVRGSNTHMKKRALMAELKDVEIAQAEQLEAEKVERQARVAEQTQAQTQQREAVVDRKAQAVMEATAASSIGKTVAEFRELSPQMQQEAVQLVETVQPGNLEEAPTEAKTAHDTQAAITTGMSLEEAQELLTYSDSDGKVHEPKPGSISAARLLSQPLQTTSKEGRLSPTQRMNRRGMAKLGYSIKKGFANVNDSFTAIERFVERLDGKEGGPLHRFFMKLRDSSYARKENTQVAVVRAEEQLKSLGFDPAWMSDTATIRKGLDLTTAQKMGVAMLAKNDKGRRNVIEGMKLTEAEADGMFESLSPAQQKVVEYMQDTYEDQWQYIVEAAMAAGMDPKQLLKEAWYSPVKRTDVDESEQHDLMTLMLAPFTQETHMPEKGFLKKRKGAAGEIELDAVSLFLQNIAKIEAFKTMAPIVAQLNKVTTNQKFVKHLNRATYGQGSRIMNKWIADTVRGQSVDSTQMAARMSKYVRHKSMVYLLNHNLLISGKQWISMFQAMAANKDVGAAMLKNMPTLTSDFKTVEKEVKDKSRLVRVRDFDREFQRKIDAQSVDRTLKGKTRVDENAVKWIKTVDNFTVVMTWKSLYDTATKVDKKTGEPKMTEAEAVKYADKWVARTQPMGDAVDLPDFFRGGELAKVLTSFQRMPNQVYNLIAHDIVGASRRGDITKTEAGRRALVSLVLPALIFGLIKRGRPQKDLKEITEDVILYPLGVLPILGSWASSAYQGFGQSYVGQIGFDELVKAIKSLKRDKDGNVNKKKFLVHAAKSAGAFTGRGGAQAIRTAEGAYDLATGETRDPRRLLYSEYNLNGKDKKSGSSSRRPRRTSRRSPRRRK